jgi:hypothetical protein
MPAMKTRTVLTIAAAATLLVAGAARAADAAPPTPPMSADAKLKADSDAIAASDRAAERAANEPNVKLTVIDDTHARIEELRVRGQLQKVTVLPKGGAPGYEILVDDGTRDLGFATGQAGARSTGGKRVWNLLHF